MSNSNQIVEIIQLVNTEFRSKKNQRGCILFHFPFLENCFILLPFERVIIKFSVFNQNFNSIKYHIILKIIIIFRKNIFL